MTKGKSPGKPAKSIPHRKLASATGAVSSSALIWGLIAGILALTWIVYWPALQNGFVWDDVSYIQNNPLIYTVDLPAIFSNYLAGNYHPVTVLVHALEYQLFGFTEGGYHAVNVGLHLINTVLVFLLVRRLSQNQWVALIAALLFGIHPLHVESVAWISQLKDLLYTLFFLLSLLAYLRFTARRQMKWYGFAFVLFALSLMSKGMAIALPLALLLIDFFIYRLQEKKVWVEKIPFFILSIVFGIVAIYAQQSAAAVHTGEFPLEQRIAFASYSFITYLQKAILPLSLNAYYPYPAEAPQSLPAYFYLYMILALCLVAACWYALRYNRKLFFGIGFYAVTIFMVLKILPIGFALMAERYMYLPSVGIFFLAGEGVFWLYKKKGGFPGKAIVVILLTGFTLFFCFITFQRCKVWKNGFTLWSDTIEKQPGLYLGYLNRGVYLLDLKNYTEAEADLDKAIELNPKHGISFFNRGMVLQNSNRKEAALSDYNAAIQLNPTIANAYVNRGNILRDRNDFSRALADYNTAIELDPSFLEAYNNKGILLQEQGLFQEAIQVFSKAVNLNPGYVNAIINRGNNYSKLNQYPEALRDYNLAISLSPKMGVAYYARGVLEHKMGQSQKACDDFSLSLSLGYANAGNALKQYCQQ